MNTKPKPPAHPLCVQLNCHWEVFEDASGKKKDIYKKSEFPVKL